MNLAAIKAWVNIAAAVAALVAAGLWWKASTVVVRPTEETDRDGWQSAQITVDHESTGPFDPFLTGIKQSQMNKWAAIAASLAALLQGIGLLLPGDDCAPTPH